MHAASPIVEMQTNRNQGMKYVSTTGEKSRTSVSEKEANDNPFIHQFRAKIVDNYAYLVDGVWICCG
jgi:hypothetical protein